MSYQEKPEGEMPAGAIGHITDFVTEDGVRDDDALAGKHVDGETGFVFDSEEAYLATKPADEAPSDEAEADKPAEAPADGE